MKGMKKQEKKHFRVIKYSVFTVLLTCLFVTGYYLISNGVIFGKFTVKDDTYTLGEVSETDQSEITVTSQSQEGAVPLTSDNEDLPIIPGFDGKKGSKENPFVFLEVVPQLSQQSFSYLVSSQEDGLPFDPVELGIKFCSDFNLGSYIDSNGNLKDRQTVVNALQNCNYTYFGNNFPSIGTADYSRINYYDLDFLYNFTLDSSQISKSAYDSASTIKDLYTNYPQAFALACPELFSVITDENGEVTSATLQDDSFLKAIEDESNWSRKVTENPDITKSYSLSVPVGSIAQEDFDSMTMSELAQKYPAIFEKDSNGRQIAAADLEKNDKWEKEKKDLSYVPENGYFILKNKGEGQYSLYNSGNWVWHDDMGAGTYYEAATTGTDTDMWDYVEGDAPEGLINIMDSSAYPSWERDAALKGDKELQPGLYYVPARNENNLSILVKESVYSFSYAKYVYTFKYAGIKINDILKRALFEREEEDYEDLHVKVITVTPDMINEMAANDTENTVDYIERADCIYISQYYDGYGEVAERTNRFVNFYNKYCGGTGPDIQSDTGYEGLISYNDNDLEWSQCMKIMKRLSTNKNLPLMWTKLVGQMWMYGVDGGFNCHLYIDENNTNVETRGALCNISKLYNITVQFDLLDSKSEDEKKLSKGEAGYRQTFMDDIFPYIKSMKLNDDQKCNTDHPAQYTGYYERNPLAISDASEEYKKRCYYLWNKFTFVPTEITGIYGSNGPYTVLSEKYGFLESYFYENAFQNATDTRGASASHGSDGNDEKNVTVAGSGHSDNVNQSIPLDSSVLDRMLEILKKILDNDEKKPEDLTLNLMKYKKYYTKMSNDTILLDYSSEAEYSDLNKEFYVKFELRNINNEDGVITKLSLVREEDSDDGIELKIKKKEDGDFINKTDVTYSNNTMPLEGYCVPQNNSLLCFVPVKIADWQGYERDSNGNLKRDSEGNLIKGDPRTILKVEWTSRMNYQKSPTNIRYYSNTGEDFINIGERELFKLE